MIDRTAVRTLALRGMDNRTGDAVAAFERGELAKARALAERELAARPGSAALQHLVGLIDCRSGRLDSGVEWLRRALETEPANVAYRVMLVRALVDSGRAREALDAAPPPTGASPADLALWHARSEAAVACGDYEAAAASWAQLADARPGDWRAMSNLAEAFAKLDRWEEAAIVLRRAAEAAPGESRIRRNLAGALARAGRHEESAAEFRSLVAAFPGEPKLRLTLARLLADLGRTEESMAEFEAAAAMTVGAASAAGQDGGLIRLAFEGREGGATDEDVEAVRQLALLLERTNRLDALRNLLVEAGAVGIARERLGYAGAAIALRDGHPAEARRLLEFDEMDADPVRWHRLMARIADAAGDPAAAFAEAVAMHEAVRDHGGWREQAREYRGRLRELASMFRGEWGAKRPVAEPGERPSPAFLVGFPRSGTTLADTFLMGHPDIFVLEEVHMLGAAEQALGGTPLLSAASREQLVEARNAYFAELDRHLDPGFAGLVVDKLPLNMMGLPLVHSLFPDAKVIFAQRHPCDAVLSGFMQSFVLNPAMACFLDIEDAADLYDAAMDLFVAGQQIAPLAVHTLVYERLVEDPEAVLRPLIDFLGLEWRPELLDHRATAKSRGAIITPSYDQVIQPLSKASSGRWRRYEQDLGPALPLLLPWADRLGY